MRRQIEAGRFKIRAFSDKVRVRNVPAATLEKHDPEVPSFININTPRRCFTPYWGLMAMGDVIRPNVKGDAP